MSRAHHKCEKPSPNERAGTQRHGHCSLAHTPRVTAPNRPEGHTRWPYRDGVRAQASGGGRQDRVGVSHAPNGPATNQHRSQGSGSPTARPQARAASRRLARRVSLLTGAGLRPIRLAAAKMEQSVTQALFFCLPGYVPAPVRSNGRAQAGTAGTNRRIRSSNHPAALLQLGKALPPNR